MEGKRKNYFSQVHHAKTDKFAVSVLFILCIGIAISTVYNYISIILLDLTHVHENIISIFLFANGIASIVGTSLFGHLINKKHDIAILIYPTVFIGVILLLGIEIHLPAFVFILMIMFGMLDGSMHTIAQYWISSSVKEALEFANGVYLFVNNLNRAIGILLGGFLIDNGLIYYIFTASMCFFALATPWVLYRIRKYTPLGCRIDYGLRRFTPQVLLNLLLK